jgi:hypothetical protein
VQTRRPRGSGQAPERAADKLPAGGLQLAGGGREGQPRKLGYWCYRWYELGSSTHRRADLSQSRRNRHATADVAGREAAGEREREGGERNRKRNARQTGAQAKGHVESQQRSRAAMVEGGGRRAAGGGRSEPAGQQASKPANQRARRCTVA